MKPILLLMTNTLRLDDHPALMAACDTGAPVVPIYIQDDITAGVWSSGGARRWWLMQSLQSLQMGLERRSSRLILRYGETANAVLSLIKEIGAGAVYLTRGYSRHERLIEEEIHGLCEQHGVNCRRFAGNLLIEPDQVFTKSGKPYQVFSPFWRQARTLIDRSTPLDAPTRVPAPQRWPVSDPIGALELAPKPADWASPIAATWRAGEAAALQLLERFLAGPSADYRAARDRPGVEATSRLSPYLAVGAISPRRIFHTATAYQSLHSGSSGVDWFIRELGWREFSYHLLFHFPDIPTKPLRSQFDRFPWQSGQGDELGAWQRGQTGFPLVDAGMRQLWQTGWMHNRIRMVTASFLVKELLWHWRDGEAWFWDTLIDADLASNAASWQWVAGCGADAAPYFRIFNPVLQGEKFDKKGDYVRRFVPELAKMPDKYLHRPFDAPQTVLEEAGVVLGESYPKPIIDRPEARKRALAALASIKATAS